jgi:hypothetical protein
VDGVGIAGLRGRRYRLRQLRDDSAAPHGRTRRSAFWAILTGDASLRQRPWSASSCRFAPWERRWWVARTGAAFPSR